LINQILAGFGPQLSAANSGPVEGPTGVYVLPEAEIASQQGDGIVTTLGMLQTDSRLISNTDRNAQREGNRPSTT
jgi:hypothetical protein